MEKGRKKMISVEIEKEYYDKAWEFIDDAAAQLELVHHAILPALQTSDNKWSKYTIVRVKPSGGEPITGKLFGGYYFSKETVEAIEHIIGSLSRRAQPLSNVKQD